MLTLSGNDIHAVISQNGIGFDQSNMDTSALMNNLENSQVQKSRRQHQPCEVEQVDS